MHKAGIPTAYFLLSGNCHVDDARNSIVQEFLLSDCTDLVFLDADVVWEPKELIKLCGYDADVVGGVYPYRREGSGNNMPVLMLPGEQKPDSQGLIEVAGLPTGFMRIKRHVLEALAEDADKFWKRTDRRAQIPILFERTYIEGTRLGGDLNFCRKWMHKGGKIHAATDIRLGHVAKTILYDSLGAAMRRESGETLRYMADKVRSGDFSPYLFAEARRYLNNPWGAMDDVLMLCAIMGKEADGPIIETGTGLTSIVLAASTTETVFCLEHDDKWAGEMQRLAEEAGVSNIEVIKCEIKDGWYAVPEGLPESFALGLNDGPPRALGSRMGFFKHFGNTKTIICDDADDKGYGDALAAWSNENGRRIDFIERAALIRE